jgi:hypothetical protein
VFIENEYDFKKLNKAAQDGRYAVTVFEPVFFRRPKPSHVVRKNKIRFFALGLDDALHIKLKFYFH